MSPELALALGAALGAEVASSRPLAGGDINQAYAVTLDDGREVFVKTHPRAAPDMYEAEARGLAFLAEAQALPVPTVLACGRHEGRTPGFLALAMVHPGARAPGFDEALGRGLATLHRFGAPCFGLDHDNYIGSLPQPNDPRPGWAAFYGEARLAPMAERAARDGLLSPAVRKRLDSVRARLSSLVGPDEPPSRLHGDLWSGNVHTTPEGGPCLIDPAAYGGHREVDLAMLRLFGQPSRRFFAAYDEVYPRLPGHDRRVPLYQLYPLLVHVNLFGGGYLGSLTAALDALA